MAGILSDVFSPPADSADFEPVGPPVVPPVYDNPDTPDDRGGGDPDVKDDTTGAEGVGGGDALDGM